MKDLEVIEMTVAGLTFDQVTRTPIVVLKDSENNLQLPIWIGLLEATAMATELEGIEMARPMTHDLLNNVLGELGGVVKGVAITELKENTYYAVITLVVGEREVVVDSRPSDAIAMALRSKTPIYVAKDVLEQSSVLQQTEQGKDPDFANVSKQKWGEILDQMSPDDFKYKM